MNCSVFYADYDQCFRIMNIHLRQRHKTRSLPLIYYICLKNQRDQVLTISFLGNQTVL